MAVTGPQRLALHQAARAALGDEEGDTLMALTPPADTDIATRQDLERVEERLGAHIGLVEERLGARIGLVEERARTYTWKVVVGTGVVLYVALVATVSAGTALLLQVLDVI